MSNDVNNLYAFGDYRLNCQERNLWRENELISLSPKLFDTLRLLVERHGEIVSKDEMLETIWADAFVEESNLTQNIYTLRQIFGKENKFIETVPRKGYRFAEPVSVEPPIARLSEPEPTAVVDHSNIQIKPIRKIERKPKFPLHVVILAGITVLFLVGIVLAFRFLPQTGAANTDLNFSSIDLSILTDTGNSVSPAISADSDFIAYVDARSGERIVRLHDKQSGGSVEIEITGNHNPGFLKFSADGKELFFRTHGRVRSGQKIYRVSYFGGEPVLVAENSWGKFDLSPDGNKIAIFRADKNSNRDLLILKDLASGKETELVSLEAPQLFFLPVAPAWSPDGEKIAYLLRPLGGHRTSIMVADVASGKIEEVKTDLSKIFQIARHSNSKNIFAISKEADKGRQIFSVEYPAGSTKKITNDFNDYDTLAISADSKHLVSEARHFQSNLWVYSLDEDSSATELTSGSYGHHSLAVLKFATEERIIYDARNELERDLWGMNLSSGTKTRLTQDNGSRNVDIATTADGKHLYLSSNRTGIDNIWRMNQDGTEPIQITFAQDEAHWLPVLSHDERYIYYLARTSDQNELRKLDLATSTTETIFASNKFMPGHFLEASPDGKYLAFAFVSEDNESDNGSNDSLVNVKIGFLDLNNTADLKETTIRTSRTKIRITNGGKSFDYVKNNMIVRQSIDNLDAEPESVFAVEGESIYNFDWSMSGFDLVVARGRSRSEVILITLQ